MAKKRSSKTNRQKKVRDYVLKEESKGFSIDQIKSRLVDAGYPESEIDAALRKYNLNRIETRQPKMQPQPFTPKRKLNTKFIGALLVAAVVIVIILWSFYPSVKDCGSDTECFIEYANNCESVKLSQSTEGTIFKYSTDLTLEITDDCTLTKAIAELDPKEPEEVKELFEGKSMVCSYDPGFFNSDWVYTITKGLESCEGDLKIAIYEMIIALYEVAQS